MPHSERDCDLPHSGVRHAARQSNAYRLRVKREDARAKGRSLVANGFEASGKGAAETTISEDQDAGEADPFRLPRRRRRSAVPPVSAGLRSASSRRNRIPESHRRTRQSDSVPASRLPRSTICCDRDEEATDAQTPRRHHHQPFPGDSGLGARAAGGRRRTEASGVSARFG